MKIVTISVFFYIILINNSFAYLDPGSAGSLFQMLLAAAAAGAAGIAVAWSKIKFFFSKLFERKKSDNQK